MALLGAHVSIAGGLPKAISRGDALRCEAIQIFTQSSRTWAISPLSDVEAREFRKAAAGAEHVRRIVAHNSYLLNLSTTNEEVRKKSVRYFITTLERCESLGIESLITHPGSHLGAGLDAGIEATTRSLDEVLAACRGFRSRVVLENTAGQGASVGCKFEHLARIADSTKAPERIGFCFDTQHAFAAGYDLRTREAYEASFEAWDKLIGTERIVAFHLNDALKGFDCRVDRHQSIGKGFLGKEAFRPLVNDPRFADVPMCVETDPGENDEGHRRDLRTLRELRNRPPKVNARRRRK